MDGDFIFDISSAPCDIEINHHEGHPRVPGMESWVLAHTVAGHVAIQQGDHTAAIGPGDLGVWRMGSEASLHMVDHARLSVLSFACEPLGVCATGVNRTPLRTITGKPGISHAATNLLRTVTTEMGQFSDNSIRTAQLSIRMLLHSMFDDSSGEENSPERHQRQTIEAVRRFIAQNLPNTSLRPTAIARHFHISVRQLHKLYQDEELSVARDILNQRIHHCARDLRDPAFRHESMSAIAARWGITDASKFSRQFRSVLGMSPREYRAGRSAA